MSGNIPNGVAGLDKFVMVKDHNNTWTQQALPPPVPIGKPCYDFTISEVENGFILYVQNRFGRQTAYVAETLNGAIDQVKAVYVADKLGR